MLLATGSTVYRFDGDAEPRAGFEAEGVRRVAEGAGLEVVAVDDGSVAVLREGCEQWIRTDIEGSVESLLVLREEPLELLVGTEPGHVYRVTSGGASRDRWVYADVHVGSIMRSGDAGETWEPVTPDLHEDVHQAATCPAAPCRVCAATARAAYVSDDRGRSWHHRADDLDERYGRAIALHPHEPDTVVTTVSDGPHGEDVHGQLYVIHDAGRHWRHVADGATAWREARQARAPLTPLASERA